MIFLPTLRRLEGINFTYKDNMEKLLKKKKEKGYIALFSTIVLIALFLLLFTGILLMSIGGMDRISDKESDIKATSLANICIEEGLNEIRRDPEFPIEDIVCEKEEGSENIVVCGTEEGIEGKDVFCEIKHKQVLEGEVEGGDMISFISKGVYFNYSTAVAIEVIIKEDDGTRTLEIRRWMEDVST